MGRPLYGHTMQLTSASTTGSGTPVAQGITVVGSTVTPSAVVVKIANNTGGALTLTSAPTIVDGRDRQQLLIVNVGTQAVTFQDQGTLPASNLRLTAAGITLGTRDSLALVFDSTIGDWLQTGTSNVI